MSRFIQILRHGFATYASTGKRCGLEVYSRVAGAQKLKDDSEKIYTHVILKIGLRQKAQTLDLIMKRSYIETGVERDDD